MFNKNDKELKKRAEMLLPTIKVASLSAYTSSLERFPSLKIVSVNDWNYFFAIASVFIATIGMNNIKISERLKTKLSEIYGVTLKNWSPDWNKAFIDCGEFFYRTIEGLTDDPFYKESPKYGIADSIGSWLVWNLLEHSPESDEERKLVRTLGMLISEEFINWWS